MEQNETSGEQGVQLPEHLLPRFRGGLSKGSLPYVCLYEDKIGAQSWHVAMRPVAMRINPAQVAIGAKLRVMFDNPSPAIGYHQLWQKFPEVNFDKYGWERMGVTLMHSLQAHQTKSSQFFDQNPIGILGKMAEETLGMKLGDPLATEALNWVLKFNLGKVFDGEHVYSPEQPASETNFTKAGPKATKPEPSVKEGNIVSLFGAFSTEPELEDSTIETPEPETEPEGN